MRHNEEYIGVDYGSVRVGLARGATAARLAEPLKTMPTEQAVSEINRLASENHVAGVVVGLPRNLSGDDTKQTQSVRSWVDSIKKEIDLPFYWQDEALTSAAAANKNAKDIDAAAAAALLQDFLDTPEEERVRC